MIYINARTRCNLTCLIKAEKRGTGRCSRELMNGIDKEVDNVRTT